MKTLNILAATSVCFAGLLLGHETRAQQTPGVTETTIQIAVEDALSGPYSQYGVPSLHGVKYVFDRVNAAGGIHGRRLEIVAEDNGCSPKNAVAVSTKLVTEKKVLAVLGLTCSSAAVAVKDSVAPNTTLPFISFSAGGWTSASPALGGLKPNYFFVAPSVHTQGGALVNFAVNEFKPKRVAFIGQTDVYGKEGKQGVEAMLAKYGMKLVAEETMESNSTDATAQVLKLQQAKPDVVIAFLYQIPAQMLLRQANELGVKATIVTSASVTDSSIYESLPPAAVENYFGSTLGRDVLDGARLTELTNNLHKTFPNVTFNPLVTSGVGAAEALVQALRNSGPNPTPEQLVAKLDELRDFYTSALAYPVTFTPQNHMGGSGVQIYKVEDKKMISIMDGYWPGNEKATEPRK